MIPHSPAANEVDWSRVETVWLDLDGTILDLQFDDRFCNEHLPASYARALGIERAAAERRLAPLFADNAGQLPFYCIDFWGGETGLDLIALKRELAHLIRPLDGALEAIRRMSRAGYNVALATNAHPDVVALKFSVTGLDGWFKPNANAHDIGHAKESPCFWQALIDDYGMAPERALFVDDSPAVAAAASAFGIGQVVGLTQPDSRGAKRRHDKGSQGVVTMPDLAALAATLPSGFGE